MRWRPRIEPPPAGAGGGPSAGSTCQRLESRSELHRLDDRLGGVLVGGGRASEVHRSITITRVPSTSHDVQVPAFAIGPCPAVQPRPAVTRVAAGHRSASSRVARARGSRSAGRRDLELLALVPTERDLGWARMTVYEVFAAQRVDEIRTSVRPSTSPAWIPAPVPSMSQWHGSLNMPFAASKNGRRARRARCSCVGRARPTVRPPNAPARRDVRLTADQARPSRRRPKRYATARDRHPPGRRTTPSAAGVGAAVGVGTAVGVRCGVGRRRRRWRGSRL